MNLENLEKEALSLQQIAHAVAGESGDPTVIALAHTVESFTTELLRVLSELSRRTASA